MDVLLVAAKKEKIADYTGVITQAGRVPVVVDVDAFALQNAYEMNYGLEPGAVVVLLNAGASAININIVSGGQSLFTRDISMGGNAYTEAVQKELNLPFESAEQAKKGEPVDGVSFDEVKSGAARDDRERAARDSEDVRLLQGHGGVRSHRSHPAERRRLRRSTASRRRSRSGSARRSNCSIRSRRSPSTRRSWACPTRIAWCRPRRWPSGSPSERRATDDQDQPPRRRAQGGQESRFRFRPARSSPSPAASILVAAALLIGWRYWSLGRESARLDQEIASAQQETAAAALGHSAGPAVRAAPRAAAAARRAHRRAAPEPDRARSTCSTRSAARCPTMLWLTDSSRRADPNEVLIEGRSTSLTRLSDFVGQSRSVRLLQALGRNREHAGRDDHGTAGRADSVSGPRDVSAAGSAPAPRRRGARRRRRSKAN